MRKQEAVWIINEIRQSLDDLEMRVIENNKIFALKFFEQAECEMSLLKKMILEVKR